MTQPSQHRPFTELIAFKETGKNVWETVHPPQRMGNAANIAYGGFAVSCAGKAACLSVPSGYHIYSLLGNFLGPALTDRALISKTFPIRKTRTFATLRVEVSQTLDSGEERACLVALADFQVKEQALLVYSVQPRMKYTPWRECLDFAGLLPKLLADKKISQQQASAFAAGFSVSESLFATRPCPEGIFSQNLMGLAKTNTTSQDALPLPQKSTAEWSRCVSPLPTQTDNVACLAFYMDGAVSFAPLSFSHMYLDDSAACSSLDFALRLFTTEIDLTKWCLREIVTHVGAEGRTYSENRLWDEGGRCVASMTQQSICRPLKGRGAVKL